MLNFLHVKIIKLTWKKISFKEKIKTYFFRQLISRWILFYSNDFIQDESTNFFQVVNSVSRQYFNETFFQLVLLLFLKLSLDFIT